MTVAVEGERGAATDVGSPESAAKKMQMRKMVGATVLVVGTGVLLWQMSRVSEPKKVEKKPEAQRAMVSYVEPPKELPKAASPAPVPAAITITKPAEPPKDEILEAARRAPLTAFNSAFKGSTASPSASPQPQGGSFVVEGENRESGAFAKRFQASTFDVARAGHIGDRRFIVAQGTSIPCVLETAMQSDQPGFVSCVVTRDVLSDNGQVVLMEKGTQVVGEYRGGLQQGQSRLHVMWSRAKTPMGVVVTLASAATDALGRAGVGGQVDNHWWERFGSALLLSVVGDASSAAGATLKSKAGVEASGTTGAGNQAAAIAVEQSGQIKPTLHKNQGEMVNIFVARDLDFSSVYRLDVTRNTGAWNAVEQREVDQSGWLVSGPRVQGGTK
jgi:type IV secretion system protein VirB10